MVLYHFSEEPSIARFVPREMATRPGERARVWAIDAAHAPIYFLPRDCPRVCYWGLPTTTPEDRARFLDYTAARMVIAIEGAWLDRVRATQLYRYALPDTTFVEDDDEQKGPGYQVSYAPVVPLAVQPVGDLLACLVEAKVELRLTTSLWPLYHALLPATLHFSMIRMRNAQPE
ncbi:MAG TPA: hypothetical protein VIL85_20535 [Thermomicrobiales bacterium]